MPITVAWKSDTQTELVFVFDAHWSLHEFFEVAEKANILMAEVEHPVHMILDVRHSKALPEGFMSGITNVSRKSHPNTGMMVMVGINAFARTFIRWYRLVYPRKPGERTIYYAGDMDEAQAIIDKLVASETNVQIRN